MGIALPEDERETPLAWIICAWINGRRLAASDRCMLGLKAETAQDVRPKLQEAFKHDGPALVEISVYRQELSMPPTITLKEVTGFGIFMLKAVLSGRGDELVDLAKVNLFR